MIVKSERPAFLNARDPVRRRGSVKFIVVDGYGVTINVERDHLVIRDGHATSGSQRTTRFARGRSDLNRIIVRAPAGTVSIAAIDWCHRLGISLAFIGSDSRLMSAWISTSVSDGPLRRAQAVAGVTDDGLRIARALLTDKLEGQIRSIEHDLHRLGIASRTTRDARRVISELRKSIATISTDLELRQLLTREAFAARLYWELLYGSPLPWPDWTHSRVPHHWLMISPREFGAVQQVRDATDPFNAILNYAYTLLEVETRIAIAANGLDPDLGLMHVDARARESLIYDLMDPVRSHVDVLCLEFCRKSGLRPHMFLELRNGVVRLDPDVCRELAAYVIPRIQAPAAASVVRFVTLLRTVKVPYRLSIRDRAPKPESSAPVGFGVCTYCGIPLKRAGRKFCSRQCTLQRDAEVRKPIELAHAKLAQLAAEGRDPRSRLGENKERSAKIAESNRKRAKYLTEEDRRRADCEKAKRFRERKKLLSS